MKIQWQVVLCGISIGVCLNWYTETSPDFSDLDLKFYHVFWPSSSNHGRYTFVIVVDYILIRDTVFDITCTQFWFFWFGRYLKISVWAIGDVVSVSIFECHRIQAIIATSLIIVVSIINGKDRWWLGSQTICLSSARIWTIVQHLLLQSSMFRAHHGTVTSSSGTTIFSFGTSEKILCTASVRYCTSDPLKTNSSTIKGNR